MWRVGRAYLCSLVHLGYHGADNVVSVTDERSSVAMSPLPTIHGFSLGQHDVEIGHEARAKSHKHRLTSASDRDGNKPPDQDLLLPAAVHPFIGVRLLHRLLLLLWLLVVGLKFLLVEALQEEVVWE